MNRISYDDFSKLDLRIGKVISAEPVIDTDRLIQLKVDIGETEYRTVVAGMRAWYSPEDLIGKSIVFLANLEPRKMRGIFSDGMILAASTSDFSDVRVLSVDGEMPPGSKIS